MVSPVKDLYRSSVKVTLILCAFCAAVCVFFVPVSDWPISAFAIFYGAGIGLLSLFLISKMADSITNNQLQDPKKKAYTSYLTRYVAYGVLLLAGVFFNLPMLGVLAGIVIQKASLVHYARRDGKENS